jgi:hypothetical protein
MQEAIGGALPDTDRTLNGWRAGEYCPDTRRHGADHISSVGASERKRVLAPSSYERVVSRRTLEPPREKVESILEDQIPGIA